MKRLDVYKQIVQDTLQEGMSDEAILWLMVVLHTHSILLRPDISIEDIQPIGQRQDILLSPLTRTDLAELFASFWAKGDQRSDKNFWFSLYTGITPYEIFDDVLVNKRDQAISARENIAGHYLVEALIEE